MTGNEVFDEWASEVLREAVTRRFAPEHRAVVLAELESLRRRWNAIRAHVPVRPGQPACFSLRERLALIEDSDGDPTYFTEKRYQTPEHALGLDREFHLPEQVPDPGRQSDRNVPVLVDMLDDQSTCFDALTLLAAKGAAAAVAVPRLVALLREGDQLMCTKVLRTLQAIGPAARKAVPAIAGLVNDPDALVRLHARNALAVIAPV